MRMRYGNMATCQYAIRHAKLANTVCQPDHVLCTGGGEGKDRCVRLRLRGDSVVSRWSLVVAVWRAEGKAARGVVGCLLLRRPCSLLARLRARSALPGMAHAIARCGCPLLCRSPRSPRSPLSPATSRCSLAPRWRACEVERRPRHVTCGTRHMACGTMAARMRAAGTATNNTMRAAATATLAAPHSSCATGRPGSWACSPSVLNCRSGCLGASLILGLP